MPSDDTGVRWSNVAAQTAYLGKLSVAEAAACSAGLYTLAQELTKRGEWFGAAGVAARLAILLDRELAKIDSQTFASGAKAVQTLVDAQPLLLGLSAELYGVAYELRSRGDPDDGDLAEICLRLVVASGDPSFAPDALLELGAMSLHRSEAHDAAVAAECYEQLVHAESPDIRVQALYGAAQAHLALSTRANAPKEWQLARQHLLVLQATPESAFANAEIIRKNVPALLTIVADLMARAGSTLAGDTTQQATL